MNLFDKANFTNSRHDFLEFLSLLREDYINDKSSWGNVSLEDFFDSIIAWLQDYHGNDVDIENPNWKTIAALFYMGKIYE